MLNMRGIGTLDVFNCVMEVLKLDEVPKNQYSSQY